MYKRQVQILLLAVYIHVDRQEMHRAGVDALAAADTLGILNTLILIACKGEECVGALDNRGIQRELGDVYKRQLAYSSAWISSPLTVITTGASLFSS